MPSPKPWSTRFALWLAVCTLLLKAAVPMLASASAQVQGKTLVEVCTVYGVKMVALDDARGSTDTAPSEHAGTHGNEHCALTAVLAYAATEPALPVLPVPAAQLLPAIPPATVSGDLHDAQAAWAARMRHGPPTPA